MKDELFSARSTIREMSKSHQDFKAMAARKDKQSDENLKMLTDAMDKYSEMMKNMKYEMGILSAQLETEKKQSDET
eukprot:7820237-Pyramimonas_sp.AAC.1